CRCGGWWRPSSRSRSTPARTWPATGSWSDPTPQASAGLRRGCPLLPVPARPSRTSRVDPCSLPVQDALAQQVDVTHCQDRHEDYGVGVKELRRGSELDGQGVEEGGLEVEDDEHHGDQVEVHREAIARVAAGGDAGLVGG